MWCSRLVVMWCSRLVGMFRRKCTLEPTVTHEPIVVQTPAVPSVSVVGAKQLRSILECSTISKESLAHTPLHSRA